MHQTDIVTRMKNQVFTVSTDGSNDDKSKQFPIVVRTFDTSTGLMNSEVLSNAICDGSATGENIFLLIEAEFTTHTIPWSNCLSLRCDNTSVMTGNKKGVISYLRGKQPDI